MLPGLFHQWRLALWICHIYVRPTLKQDIDAIKTPIARSESRFSQIASRVTFAPVQLESIERRANTSPE